MSDSHLEIVNFMNIFLWSFYTIVILLIGSTTFSLERAPLDLKRALWLIVSKNLPFLHIKGLISEYKYNRKLL